MRAEEKELEGPELEREQRVEASHREAHEEEELPEVVGEEVRDISLDHRSRLFDALRLVLAGEHCNVALMFLPQRETRALEALQAAVNGSDSMGEFVFAEDRKALLEQSLAVLQQNLTYGEPAQIAELQSKFDSMSSRVGELREQLVNLEDAQEEIDEFHNAAREKRGAPDDKDDADKPEPEDAGLVDFIAEALVAIAGVSKSGTSTLAGEERAPEAPKPSSLVHGPAIEDAPKPASTLTGPEVKDAPRPASTLTGPELKEAPKPPSSLTGPEIEPAPKPPSSLAGDAPQSAGPMHDPAPQRRVTREQEPPGTKPPGSRAPSKPPSRPTPNPTKPPSRPTPNPTKKGKR